MNKRMHPAWRVLVLIMSANRNRRCMCTAGWERQLARQRNSKRWTKVESAFFNGRISFVLNPNIMFGRRFRDGSDRCFFNDMSKEYLGSCTRSLASCPDTCHSFLRGNFSISARKGQNNCVNVMEKPDFPGDDDYLMIYVDTWDYLPRTESSNEHEQTQLFVFFSSNFR